MKALILEFAEKPTLQELDFSIIEYCPKQNLSVVKNTSFPAIKYVSMDTATCTKAYEEPTDSDHNLVLKLGNLLDTGTETLQSTEVSDSDRSSNILKRLMDTQTITESVEGTDSDK